jgi:hypothetical protein
MAAGVACLPALPEERGPIETLPGRNTKTDRVREEISEGVHLAESEWIALRGTKAVSLWLLDIREFESTSSLEARACV